jgi:hypothetical protein
LSKQRDRAANNCRPVLFKEPEMTTKKVHLDISDFDTVAASNAGAELQLVNPIDKSPLDIFINILGPDSETYREFMRDSSNANFRKQALAQRKGIDADIRTSEEIEAKSIELLTACTTGWRTADKPVIIMNKEELVFNANNVLKVYIKMLWIRRQVDAFLGDLTNFMKMP